MLLLLIPVHSYLVFLSFEIFFDFYNEATNDLQISNDVQIGVFAAVIIIWRP